MKLVNGLAVIGLVCFASNINSQSFSSSRMYDSGQSKSKVSQSKQQSDIEERLTKEYKEEIIQKLYGGKIDTEVLHDSGKSISIERFYKKDLDVKSQEEKRNQYRKAKQDVEKGFAEISEDNKSIIQNGHFPVEPKEISLLTIATRSVLRDIPHIEHNIFIVGDDAYSLNWMRENKSELLRFNASGVLTKVSSLERYKQIAEEFKPLSLLPVSADFAVLNFGVKNYPVLITSKGEFR